MTVYVLVASAVYDHGVIGVYESEDEARAAAKRIYPLTDGHHRFSIRPREVGVTYGGQFDMNYVGRSVGYSIEIEVQPEPAERMTP